MASLSLRVVSDRSRFQGFTASQTPPTHLRSLAKHILTLSDMVSISD